MSELTRRLHRVVMLFMAVIGLMAITAPLPAADEQTPLARGRIEGRFMLLDHFGEVVTDRTYSGKFLLIYFGYTGCPDVCPTAMLIIDQALALLGENAEQIQPLLISVDPDRDTPAVMREFVSYFNPRLIGLTGSREMIDRVTQNFRVRYEKVQLPSDPPDVYRVDHSAGVFLMGPDGAFLTKFAHSATPQQIAARIRDYLP